MEVELRGHLEGLVGKTIPTITGQPNQVVAVDATTVYVVTEDTEDPDGEPVPISDLEAAAETLAVEGEVRINPASVGYRSAFVGAALATLDGVEALRRPARLRLAHPSRDDRATRLILTALDRLGGKAERNEIIELAVSEGDFAPKDLIPHSRGRSQAHMDIGWGLSRLAREGLVENVERGVWALTEAGRSQAAEYENAGRRPARNPPWENDELILALDLYVRRGLLDDTDEEVVELSRVLNALPLGDERRANELFRNPNGVAMKLGNFARLDPTYAGAGLTRGGRREVEVWDRYRSNPDELRRIADQLRAVASGALEPPVSEPVEDAEAQAQEGRILFRRHRVRERDRSLVRKKKDAVRKATGTLSCEVCGLDPLRAFGELGETVIECHHLVPLADGADRRTRLADLALVCRNCHAAIHAGGITRSLDEVREVVAASSR